MLQTGAVYIKPETQWRSWCGTRHCNHILTRLDIEQTLVHVGATMSMAGWGEYKGDTCKFTTDWWIYEHVYMYPEIGLWDPFVSMKHFEHPIIHRRVSASYYLAVYIYIYVYIYEWHQNKWSCFLIIYNDRFGHPRYLRYNFKVYLPQPR